MGERVAICHTAHVLVFTAIVAPMAYGMVGVRPILVFYRIVAVYAAVFTACRGYGNGEDAYKENGRNNDG